MLIVVVTVHRVWLLVSVLVILATLETIAVQVLTSLKHTLHYSLLQILMSVYLLMGDVRISVRILLVVILVVVPLASH